MPGIPGGNVNETAFFRNGKPCRPSFPLPPRKVVADTGYLPGKGLERQMPVLRYAAFEFRGPGSTCLFFNRRSGREGISAFYLGPDNQKTR